MSRIDIIGQNGNDGEVYHWLHKHGHRPKGGSSPTYVSWISMKSRCNDKSNPNYGGRGISYDKRWEDFIVFLSDMGDRPEGCTLDRIDSSKDYSEENCRWATPEEQSKNRSTNIYVEFEGELVCLSDCEELSGVPRTTLYKRYHKGLRGEELFAETCHMKRDGEHYLVEKIARAICGESPDFKLGGQMEGKCRWQLFIPNALRVLEVLDEDFN